MQKITPVILAAGQGTRMKSKLPQMLHKLCGQPMVFYALNAARAASTETPVMVVGHGAEAVQAAVGEAAHFVVQEEQLGTGHAVMQAESLLAGKPGLVLVTYGDMPLLRAETVQKLVEAQQANPGPMTLLTVIAEDPRGFGRIVRKADGTVAAIVEEAQADASQLAIKELNVGAYCFRSEWLWPALKRIPLSPKGEYYLTDTVALAVEENLPVQAIVMDDMVETIGVNSRVHLAEAESAMRKRINTGHMLNGVTMIQPETTYIEAGVSIGRDTILWPNTYLHGKTSIGEDCAIGPNTIIRNTKIGDRCKVLMADLEGAILENDVDMGPFARLRKGAHLGNHVHMGNFGEVKDSHLAEGVKMGHFSYIGDTQVGKDVNIGCGTITCNYDGKKKNKTIIGDRTFIGSGSMLVAPLKIGEDAYTGAGSVVTHDVEDKTIVVGVPARLLRKVKDSD